VSPDVLFYDIPDSVLDEVRLGIQHYFAPLLVLSPEHPKHSVDLAGSGTLVELAGRHYILTADHVWNATEDWDEIGLVVAAEGAPLAIPRNNILPKRLHVSPYSQWGPDLALLEKPPHLVSTIRTRKSFLNLARRRSMLRSHPPQIEKALWAVMGLVGQSSEVEAIPETRVVVASLRGEAFFGVTCKADRRNGYDYLTTYAKTTLPGVPSSFKRGQRRRALAGHTEDEGWNYRLAGRASLPRGCILARTTAFGSRRHPLPWPTEYLPESVG